MADLSLDDYIKTRNKPNQRQRPATTGQQKFGGNRNNNGRQQQRAFSAGSGIKSRLGTNRQLGKQGQLNVRPKPNQHFQSQRLQGIQDARQKIVQSKRGKIKDARDKIIEKTKFVDARVKIQNNLAKKGGLQTKQGPKNQAIPKVTIRNKSGNELPIPKIRITGNTSLRSPGLIDDDYIDDDDLSLQQYGEISDFRRTIPTRNDLGTTRDLLGDRIQYHHQAPTVAPEFRISAPKVRIANDYYSESPASPPRDDYNEIGLFSRVKHTLARPPIVSRPTAVGVTSEVGSLRSATSAAANVISPLQGFKVLVTNLHPSVSRDDIIELFGSSGTLKKARIVKKGSAEVVFVKREDALMSIRKYHNRELDGLPMSVKLLTPADAVVAEHKYVPEVPLPHMTSSQPRYSTGPADINVIQTALFKPQSSIKSKPTQRVNFTVKLES